MQRIEKYAVIALVLLLVTILAVSLWSQKKGKSPFSIFKKSSESSELAQTPIGGDPNGAVGFETTSVGTPPDTGLAPRNAAGAQAQGGLDGATLPADWRPGDPWVNRGRVAEQSRQDPFGAAVQPSAQPGTGFVVDTPASSLAAAEPAPKPSATPQPRKASPVAAGPTYVVQRGDTLGEIAARELGSFDKWTEIAALNGNLDPKRLKQGMKLVLPAGAKSASKPKVNGSGAVAPGGEYVVQKGDTLSGIAQKVLGKGSRWTEIAALNPNVDANRLVVGARLRLPKGAPVASANVAKVERGNRVR